MSQLPLILATASPRRRELLSTLGVACDVVTAEIEELDEKSAPALTPTDLARENARRKATAVAKSEQGRQRWVLGADTVVTCHQLLYAKPASLDQARDFLRALSGRTHEVITGCALIAPDLREEIFHDLTRVTFRVLSEEIITRYLAEVAVLDKAGAYALQERGEWIIERVEGSRDNVIGLPTERVREVFLKHGLL